MQQCARYSVKCPARFVLFKSMRMFSYLTEKNTSGSKRLSGVTQLGRNKQSWGSNPSWLTEVKAVAPKLSSVLLGFLTGSLCFFSSPLGVTGFGDGEVSGQWAYFQGSKVKETCSRYCLHLFHSYYCITQIQIQSTQNKEEAVWVLRPNRSGFKPQLCLLATV